MDKHELAEHLARRASEPRGHAADKLDALVYKLWKESRFPKLKRKDAESPARSTAQVKQP